MSNELDDIKIEEVYPGSFIFVQKDSLSKDLCERIIQKFENDTENQYTGIVGSQVNNRVDTSLKRSTDLFISVAEGWEDIDTEIFEAFQKTLLKFSKMYPYFERICPNDKGYRIHRTEPGEFYHWHVENDGPTYSDRQLVALWYLNDVESPGGETEFKYQNVKVSPSQGTLVLFPAAWTHEHRGCEVLNGTKYTIVSWVIFGGEVKI